MKIKLQPLFIDPSDPFKNDPLDREKSAHVLTEFIKSLDEPYVIALDASWGAGKTTFFRMWRAYLDQKDIHSIYFNAWEADFNENALIPLINEISFSFNGLKNGNTKRYLSAAKNAGISLLKHGFSATTKLVTLGAIDATKIVEDTISSATAAFAEEQFSSYKESKESLKKFKKNLEGFAEEIFKKTGSPLVFIVDELDRCRPDYAVQVLEKIKHLFSVKNIVFILGIDKQQIFSSIKSLYGQINTKAYLARFIDIDYYLPEPDLEKFIKFTIERHGLKSFFESRKKIQSLQYDEELIEKTFVKLFKVFKFKLRDIEQIISNMVIVIRITKENECLFPELLCFLLVLRRAEKDLYLNLKHGIINPEELFQKLHLNISSEEYELIRIKIALERSFDYKNNYPDKSFLDKYSKWERDPAISQEQKEVAKTALHFIKFLPNQVGDMISFLTRKIEISEGFKELN